MKFRSVNARRMCCVFLRIYRYSEPGGCMGSSACALSELINLI